LKEDKLEGLHRVYYENGQLEAEGTCKDGKLDGQQKWYNESGQLEKERAKQKIKKILNASNRPLSYPEIQKLSGRGVVTVVKHLNELIKDGDIKAEVRRSRKYFLNKELSQEDYNVWKKSFDITKKHKEKNEEDFLKGIIGVE